jgi:cytochrome c biogenesis protein CcmG/thiol:disulfide interchange protein DsbE
MSDNHSEKANDADTAAVQKPYRRGFLYIVPAVVFGGLAAVLGFGLMRKPNTIPSVLVGKPIPKFSLPPVVGRTLGLSDQDLRGEVSLVNVFASWCPPCRDEHPLLVKLAETKTVPIYGLNYKDAPANAARWLGEMGDPYARTGADENGRVAIDWGVYGVPETFVINAKGEIAYKHIGPLSEKALAETILPLVERLRTQQTD